MEFSNDEIKNFKNHIEEMENKLKDKRIIVNKEEFEKFKRALCILTDFVSAFQGEFMPINPPRLIDTSGKATVHLMLFDVNDSTREWFAELIEICDEVGISGTTEGDVKVDIIILDVFGFEDEEE